MTYHKPQSLAHYSWAPRETLTVETLSRSIGRCWTTEPFCIDPGVSSQFWSSTYIDLVYGEHALRSEETIAGFYLLSLTDALRASLYGDDPAYDAFNYGGNKVRFVSPVLSNDTLVFSCTILDVQEKSPGYLVTQDLRISIEGKDRPGLVAEWLYFLMPKHNSAVEAKLAGWKT